MQIEYNYKIVKVDEENKVMEVLYTPYQPDNLKEYLVGTRMPFSGESLDHLIQSYAPMGLWTESLLEYESVIEGTEGKLVAAIGIFTNNDSDSNPV